MDSIPLTLESAFFIALTALRLLIPVLIKSSITTTSDPEGRDPSIWFFKP